MFHIGVHIDISQLELNRINNTQQVAQNAVNS